MDPASQAEALPDLVLHLRLAAQAATILALGQAAWWASARLTTPHGLGERALAATLLYLAATTGLATLLGLAGWFSALPFVVCAAVVWGASYVWARPASIARAGASASVAPMPAALGAAAIVVLCLYVPPLLRTIFEVPVRWDTLTYHLFIPAAWIEAAAVFNPDLPYPFTFVAHYPKHHELHLATTMVVARNDLFAETASLALYLTSGLATACLCGRLGASRNASVAAGLFVLTLPAHFVPAAGAYAEGLLVTVLIGGLVFALASLQSMRASASRLEPMFLCGLAMGLAAGTKYTALDLGACLAVVLAIAAWRAGLRGRALARLLAAYGLTAVVAGGVWYALNVVAHGNPFHPVPVGPFAGVDRVGLPWEGASILARLGPLLESGELVDVWLGRHADRPWLPSLGWKLVPIVALAGYGAVALLRARAAGAGLAVLALAVLVFGYLRTPYWSSGWLVTQTRFAVPALCVAAAIGFAALGRRGVPPSVLAGLVFAGVLLDAPFLDLTTPDARWDSELGRLAFAGRPASARMVEGRWLAAVLSIVGVAWWIWSQQTSRRLRVQRIALIVAALLTVAFVAAPSIREPDRYVQYRRLGAPSPKRHHAPAAEWLERNHAGRTLAIVESHALEFPYLYAGRAFDRRIEDGRMRDLDEATWRRALIESGSELLLCLRWPTTAMPKEAEAARRAQWEELHSNDWFAIFEIGDD